MTFEERSDLVLALARTLYVNGQSTDQTLAAAEQLGDTLGLRARIMPRWGELQLQAEDGDAKLISVVAADPAGVDMDRVASAVRAIDDLRAGRLAPAAAVEAIDAISRAPPAATWLFTLAAAAGAVALAVIFGVQHLAAALLIFASAAAGAILRRCLAQHSANVFLQPFCAALLAGVIGALAVRFQLSSSLRLVAVCPCMVLVPGPHVLNGALDLLKGRIHLGAARLIVCGAHHCSDLDRIAAWTGAFRRLPAGRSRRQSRPFVARRDRRRRRRRFLQHLLLHTAQYAALAGGGRHAGPRATVGGTHRARFQRRRRRSFRLYHRRADTHSSLTSSAHAVCGNRLRLRGVDDPRRLPFQGGERASATCRRLASDVRTPERHDRRRRDRRPYHFRHEPRSHHSEVGHRSPCREID